MDSLDYELSRELRGFENDKRMTERAVSSEQNRWKERLMNGSTGRDIDAVMSGKVKVKLSLKEKISYKLRGIKNIFTKKK